jgi:hypothetical protein
MANPTTNYGWVLPTSTDLVTDLPADFDVALQGVDTTTKALNPATTLGDLQYRSATANTNTRLAIGSTGNVLTVAGGVPTWAAPAGGGKLLQVIQGTKSTASQTTSTSFVDTGLSVSITPTSATSKILVQCFVPQMEYNTNINSGSLQIIRGASTVVIDARETFNMGAASYTYARSIPVTLIKLDEPATTSALTYKLQFRSENASLQTSVNAYAYTTMNLIVSEIGA